MTDLAPLLARIADKRDDLIALTQDLIRIPTLNPPGDNYRDICDYLDRRLTSNSAILALHQPVMHVAVGCADNLSKDELAITTFEVL